MSSSTPWPKRRVRETTVHAGYVLIGGVQLVVAWSTAISCVALVAWVALPIAAFLLLPPIFLRRRIYKIMTGTWDKRARRLPEFRRAYYFTELALDPRAAKELRSFGLEDWLMGNFRERWTAARRGVFEMVRDGLNGTAGAIIVLGASFAAVTALIGAQAADGRLGSAPSPRRPMRAHARRRDCSRSLPVLGRGRSALVPALEKVRAKAPAAASSKTGRGDGCPADSRNSLRESVIRDPNATTPLLDGLDLTILTGRSLGLVGPNGAGKTTILALLTQLFVDGRSHRHRWCRPRGHRRRQLARSGGVDLAGFRALRIERGGEHRF